jgi:predicted RNA binding protein YcfA (HicA-like mRNA interferase family)
MFRGGDTCRELTSSCKIRYAREMKVRDMLQLLHDYGWLLVATKGSHRQLKHPTKSGRVTVAGKPGDDLAPGTLNSILKQANLSGEE